LYSPFTHIKFNHTSTKEIDKITKFLKSLSSCGYDEVYIKIWKMISPFISSPLYHVCNKSLSLGIFPSLPNYSVIKALFKNSDYYNVTHFKLALKNYLYLHSFYIRGIF